MTCPPAPLSQPRRRLSLGVAGMTVAGAVVGVAAFLQTGGLDIAFVPPMAAQPFVMEDGTTLYVQAFEVTIADWNRCADAAACDLRLRAPHDGDDADYPATGLNWIDVNQYLDWINANSRHNFRLPTLAEWMAMAEAILPEAPDPIFTDPALTWASTYLTEGLGDRRLRPSGSYSISPEGISDLDGNVWEWTQECYRGAGDGVFGRDNCPAYYVGGEHDAVIPFLVRDPARGGCAVGTPPAHLGMRMVTDLRSKHRAKPVTQIPNRFVADLDAALVQQIPDVAMR